MAHLKKTPSEPEVLDVASGEVTAPQDHRPWKTLLEERRSVIACFSCASAAVMIGYDMQLIGSIIANEQFIMTFGRFDHDVNSWTLPASRQLVWTVVQFAFAAVGAFSVGFLSDIFGRRVCSIITVILTLCGTITELFSPNWKVWIVAKLFFGLAMGFMQGNVPPYVSELAPVAIRGFMLSLFQFWIAFGSFLGSCVLEGTSKIDGAWSWKAAIVSQFGFAGLCALLLLLFVPESPYSLLARHKTEAARSALFRLRGTDRATAVELEMRTITGTLQHESQLKDESAASYLECFRGADLRRTLLACLPMAMQQFSGFPLCGNYLAYFLALAGLSQPFLITVISSLLSLLAILLAFALIETAGRRPQLLGGTAMLLLCVLGMGVLGCVARGTPATDAALAAVSVVWNFFYYLSVGAVGWTVVGEISSARLRAKTASVAVMANAVLNGAWAVAVPYLINADELGLGPKAGFIFLGTGSVLAGVCFFVMPETKGLSFDQLDALFEVGTPARRFGKAEVGETVEME